MWLGPGKCGYGSQRGRHKHRKEFGEDAEDLVVDMEAGERWGRDKVPGWCLREELYFLGGKLFEGAHGGEQAANRKAPVVFQVGQQNCFISQGQSCLPQNKEGTLLQACFSGFGSGWTWTEEAELGGHETSEERLTNQALETHLGASVCLREHP